MTLAQRVRDQRYAKGWGPDELASRASISRTALYQIESGKTEQPRAATVRRIAEALNIPTETLLGPSLGVVGIPWQTVESATLGGSASRATRLGDPDSPALRFQVETTLNASQRDRDLEHKFHELLRSPFGEGVARILEESHRFLARGTAESSR